MSRENVDLVRRGYAALNQNFQSGELDFSLIEKLWTQDCVLVPSGLLPESREMQGHAGIAQFATAQMEAFEQMWVEPLEFIEAGDRVVVPVRFGGKARHTGIEVEFSVVHVFTVRNGKLARLDMHADKPKAFEAAGLTE
jgi:uncharacterized protein